MSLTQSTEVTAEDNMKEKSKSDVDRLFDDLKENVTKYPDEQLNQMIQQGNYLALMAMRFRNDMRRPQQPMGEQPAIAQQVIGENRQLAGIGTGGMPNAEAISPMAANGVGALPDQMPSFPRDDTGILAAASPMTMTAADGGIVELAGGGQVLPFQAAGVVPGMSQQRMRLNPQYMPGGYLDPRATRGLTDAERLRLIARTNPVYVNPQQLSSSPVISGMGEPEFVSEVGDFAGAAVNIATKPVREQIETAAEEGNPMAQGILTTGGNIAGLPEDLVQQRQRAIQAGSPYAEDPYEAARSGIRNIGSKLKSDFQKTDFGSRFGKFGEGVRPYTGASEAANRGKLGLGALMPDDGIVGVADRIGKKLREFGGDLKRSRDDLGLYLTEDVPAYYKKRFKASQEKPKIVKKDDDKPKPSSELLDPNANEKLSKADANALALTGKKEQQVKAIKDSVVGEFAKGKDKKETGRFNEFLIRLGLGTMAAENATGLLDAVSKSAGPAFEAYTKAKQADKANVLAETKLNIQRERNQILGDYQRAAIAAKTGLTGGDQIKLFEYVNTQVDEVNGIAQTFLDTYLKERKNKIKAENSVLPPMIRDAELTHAGWFGSFRDIDSLDDLDPTQASLFTEAAKTQLYQDTAKMFSGGGATQANVPAMGASVGGVDPRLNLILQRRQELQARQGG